MIQDMPPKSFEYSMIEKRKNAIWDNELSKEARITWILITSIDSDIDWDEYFDELKEDDLLHDALWELRRHGYFQLRPSND